MFEVLEGTGGDVLGVEISGGYTMEDVREFRAAFEKALEASGGKVNILCKIDRMSITESEFKAFVEDSRQALAALENMRHLAIVGHSRFQEYLIKLDNLLLGSAKKERIEKYFDVADMDRAWEFVRS